MGDYHRTVGTWCLLWEFVGYRETRETLPPAVLYMSIVGGGGGEMRKGMALQLTYRPSSCWHQMDWRKNPKGHEWEWGTEQIPIVKENNLWFPPSLPPPPTPKEWGGGQNKSMKATPMLCCVIDDNGKNSVLQVIETHTHTHTHTETWWYHYCWKFSIYICIPYLPPLIKERKDEWIQKNREKEG